MAPDPACERSLIELSKLSDFCAIGTLDAFVLSGKQMMDLKTTDVGLKLSEMGKGFSAAIDKEMRPHCAHWTPADGFMMAMTPESRDIINATTFVELGKQKVMMRQLEEMVSLELQVQLALKTLDIRALYGSFDSLVAYEPLPTAPNSPVKVPNSDEVPEIPDDLDWDDMIWDPDSMRADAY